MIAQQEAEQEKIKKNNAQATVQKLHALAQEIQEEKADLEKNIEDDYISIKDEININEGHCYCFSDPTRPHYRKIGKSSKDQNCLVKQYIPRYMPEGINLTNWLPFNNSKLAEDHIFEKLKSYRIKNTEWFKFNLNENEIDPFIEDIFRKYKSFIDNE